MSEPALKCEIMLFLSKTILQNCAFLLKYPILAVLASGEIYQLLVPSCGHRLILSLTK